MIGSGRSPSPERGSGPDAPDRAADARDSEVDHPMSRRVAILGCGKLGESLLAGLLSANWLDPSEIVVTGRRGQGICARENETWRKLAVAQEVLEYVGRGARVPGRYMDAVTAVAGSGPAYFALLAEAMIEAGILLGLSREISTQLVVQTMLGTAKLLRDEHMHPVELREQVTSPGGTTIRAIRELERA